MTPLTSTIAPREILTITDWAADVLKKDGSHGDDKL
jgi:hypothetical protein